MFRNIAGGCFNRVRRLTFQTGARKPIFAANARRMFVTESIVGAVGCTKLVAFGAGALAGTLALLGYQKLSTSPNKDYAAVRTRIAEIIDDVDYDDPIGSYGPVFVRLAWHASGTYDKYSKTGGSNGATMRFEPECGHGANAGLQIARNKLEEVKKDFPWISHGDLWTLAAVVAIEEMGGPKIPWRPGRTDAISGSACPPDGRLPDGDKGADHVRYIFYKMGFNDQEIAALIGAHTLGKCHEDRSGFDGPWTRSPTTFSNLFYQEVFNTKWTRRRWSGPPQYEDPSGTLMMLEADLVCRDDPGFRKYALEYANDQDKFFKDFANAFQKLLELGCDSLGPEK